MKKGCFLLFAALISSMLLGGCQGQQAALNPSKQEETSALQTEEIDYRALFREMEAQEYMQGNWKAENIEKPTHYRKVDQQKAEIFALQTEKQSAYLYQDAARLGEKAFYSVVAMTDSELRNTNYVLCIYDYETQGTEQFDLTDTIFEKYSFFRSIVFSGDRLVVLCQKQDEDGNFLGMYACDWQDGALAEGVDLYPAMEGYVDTPQPYYMFDMDLQYEAVSNQYYLISMERNQIVTIGRDGVQGRIYGEERTNYSFFTQTPEGLWLFQAVRGGEPAEIFYFDSDGAKKVLYQGEEISCKTACMDSKGNVLYVGDDGQSIVEWKVCSGERRKIFTTIGEYLKYPLGLWRDENGEITVFDQLSGLGGMTHIVAAGEVVEVVLHVRSETWVPDEIKKSLTTYSIAHPGVTFEFEPEGDWQNRDITVGQMYTDIAEGGGADLLILSDEKMKNLVEKDCLLDLSEMLSKENRAAIYEGILESGRVDGKLYLVTLTGGTEIVFVKKEVWNKPEWTVTEFMDVVEKLDGEKTLQAAAGTGFCWYSKLLLLNRLTYNLVGEGLVDPERGESFLDSEKFRRILQFCRKYGNDDRSYWNQDTYGTGERLLKDGECAVMVDRSTSFTGFSAEMKQLGEECVVLGWPGCSGGIMYGDMGLCVNKNTPYPDLMADLLNEIVSVDYTNEFIGSSMPIRRDALDGRVTNATGGSQGHANVRLDRRTTMWVDAKPDGTSFLKEYTEVLDRAVTPDTSMEEVRKIILEEAESYFQGGRSLENTIEVMQSRVRLYLKEQL